ncbi:MAG TPA: ATP-binding protein [Chloroflexota bacterium]|nr:ATP-binding protein [Chloroflexota bacterium]
MPKSSDGAWSEVFGVRVPDERSVPVGAILGTETSSPLEWWVAVAQDQYLQLDDVVLVRTAVAGAEALTKSGELAISGVVDMVQAKHEASNYPSDVFLANEGVLPLQVARWAHVVSTRLEPELWVPPSPGDAVVRVRGLDREKALHFDGMEERLIAGLSRDGQPIFIDLSFVDGRRGAHVNISGISGVATKTTYAGFLLYSLFHSNVLGIRAANTKALVFNVKGEDLLFLDRPNTKLSDEDRSRYEALGLPHEPFRSVGIWAPVNPRSPEAIPDTGSRQEGVQAYFWTVRDFVKEGMLRFMFSEAGDERSQIADVVARVESTLQREAKDVPGSPATVYIQDQLGEDVHVKSFRQLCQMIEQRLEANDDQLLGHTARGTISAFMRRLDGARAQCGHLIKGDDASNPGEHRIDWTSRQVSVIDIHNLHDRAKRFVVGVVVKRLFEEKEASGSAEPLVFIVLDELNKYAPRDGWSPMKEVLLDISERGRSLGIILIGAQQTASEVERRIVSNAAIRIAGRLDPAEALRPEYGFLSDNARKRAVLLKPGTMLLQQPQLPMPLEVTFPFPAWATRVSEAAPTTTARSPFAEPE